MVSAVYLLENLIGIYNYHPLTTKKFHFEYSQRENAFGGWSLKLEIGTHPKNGLIFKQYVGEKKELVIEKERLYFRVIETILEKIHDYIEKTPQIE